MSGPAVSILVPTFNCAQYLPQLCGSIQRQSFEDFEVILWDDGSTDSTAEVLETYLRDARFQLQRSPQNQGLGKTWRALLSAARGRFWCSPGADDVLFPDYLERRVAWLNQEPAAGLIHGPPVCIDATGTELSEVWVGVQPPPVQNGADSLLALLQHNYINQPSALVRTATTMRILGQWHDHWKFAPDWHLWILHAATEEKFLYDSKAAHQYRIHPRSLTGSPEHDALRRIEVRLVPLVAARGAAAISPWGAQTWKSRRRALYSLWLRRAWMLRSWPGLAASLQLGAEAFETKGNKRNISLVSELVTHAPEVLWYGIREALARRRQRFQVSGLAQINHRLFSARG